MLYKICVPARKQCEYGRKRSEAVSRGGDGDGIPSEKRTCAPKRRGGVHKASDPDVSHAGSCDGHGGGAGIFVTVETEKRILYVLAARWKMPAAGMGRSRRNMGGVCMQLKKFLMEEDGVGVIEVVLILVGILTPYH